MFTKVTLSHGPRVKQLSEEKCTPVFGTQTLHFSLQFIKFNFCSMKTNIDLCLEKNTIDNRQEQKQTG